MLLLQRFHLLACHLSRKRAQGSCHQPPVYIVQVDNSVTEKVYQCYTFSQNNRTKNNRNVIPSNKVSHMSSLLITSI
jgi:hypothetical protein